MIQILRGTNAQRVAYGGLEVGRFMWCTDTTKLYLGTAAGDKEIALTGAIDEFIELSDTFAAWAGTADKILKVNSTPDGIVAKDHPGTVGCRVYGDTNQPNIGAGVDTLVEFNQETYDIGGDFNTGTYKFICPVDGYYETYLQIYWAGMADGKRQYSKIFVDGAAVAQGASVWGAASNATSYCKDLRHLAAAKEITGIGASNDAAADIQADILATFMIVKLISAD